MTLYSTGCPRCNVLKKKLSDKNIRYELSDNVERLSDMGFRSVPVLEVDGNYMDFSEAVKWVNAQ